VNVVVVVQARMSSTRLPGKVLLDVAGRPMLARVLDRARRARTLGRVGVATSTDASDDRLEAFCKGAGVPCCRGSLGDVLDRYHGAARQWQADVIVRITGDCPLIDPGVVDRVVNDFLSGPAADYVSNVVPARTFPRGLDVEVFSAAALGRAWRENDNPAWREHVTPFLYRRPDLFRTRCVVNDADHSSHRWTVDTPEDLELVRRVYAAFGHDRFGWGKVLALLERHPDWQGLNAHVGQKPH
jgi:spore coat polysaccharide biosynthesis protein SpsF